MQKSYLSSFHNDPKLNRYPQDKKIQPLFKKSFPIQDELLLKPETEDLKLSNTSNISLSRPTSSDVKIKSRNISTKKLENSNESTKDNLEFVINKLKSEKLEVFKELLTYEEKYQHKLCLRARLEEMKNLCNELQEMSRILTERLDVENDLYGFLQIGILSLTEDKFSYKDSSSDEENSETDDFVKVLYQISGIPCVCIAKLSETGFIQLSIYPYLFSEAVGVDLELTADSSTLANVLYDSVLPFLSFSLDSSLKLQVFEPTNDLFEFLIKICNLKIPQSIKLKISNDTIEITVEECKIKISDSFLLKLLKSFRLLEASNYISQNLGMLFIDHEKKLAWQARA
jgi:hypothetical protein